jgi:hypothetical protein
MREDKQEGQQGCTRFQSGVARLGLREVGMMGAEVGLGAWADGFVGLEDLMQRIMKRRYLMIEICPEGYKDGLCSDISLLG